MTKRIKTEYDPAAHRITGRGWKVSCYVDGTMVWQQYCSPDERDEIIKEDDDE